MRLNRELTAIAKQSGVRFVPGSKVTGFEVADGRIASIVIGAAGGPGRWSRTRSSLPQAGSRAAP